MTAALIQHAQNVARQATTTTTTTATPNIDGLQLVSVGALVGGIVGGVLGGILLFGLIAWLIIAQRRKSKARAAGHKEAM
jgi:predicted lipid-binding transport protein (Tim44 family)